MKLKCGCIPAGTKIELYGMSFVLQKDVTVDASQEFVERVLDAHKISTYRNGISSGKVSDLAFSGQTKNT